MTQGWRQRRARGATAPRRRHQPPRRNFPGATPAMTQGPGGSQGPSTFSPSCYRNGCFEDFCHIEQQFRNVLEIRALIQLCFRC